MCSTYAQDIIGPITLEDLKKEPFAEWFNTEYENYAPFGKTIAQLDAVQEDVAVTIFMGTWCSDSKMHVPAFFRILDEFAFSGEVQIIGVDRDKNAYWQRNREWHHQRTDLYLLQRRQRSQSHCGVAR